MNDQADQTITTLRTGHDELAALVVSMTLDDLTRPSAAAEWDISQVLSHLGSGAEIGLATLEAALEGTGNPGPEFNPSVWARWDAMTPSERAEGFLRADEALVKRYESLDNTARAQLRINLGFLPEPVDVATAAALRLSEPDRSFGLDLRDAVTLVDTPAQPAGVLDAPAEAWLRLAAGRLAPQHTPPTMRLTSDTITLDDLRRVFPGF